MFFHTFHYSLKCMFRQKETVFWNLLFPIVLGTMFYIAFSGMSEDEMFHPIPVAVVLEHAATNSSFQEVIDSLNTPGDDRFLDAVYTTKEEALSLLKQKEIVGILYEGTPLTLTVSAEMSNMKLEQSILDSFVERYNLQYRAIEQIAVNHPEKLAVAVDMLAKDTAYNTESSFSDGDMDAMVIFFFNLIAMSCLFSSMGGTQSAVWNQANLSALGARKCISPIPRVISYLGTLSGTFLYQFFCVMIGLFYILFVLKVNFGNEVGYVILTTFLGCMTGVSFGFCIGCISHLSEHTKFGISMATIMTCCFLSGLMVGNIRIYVEQICPWFNRINPAALISDSFYALTVYQSHDRYFANSITLVLLSVLFCLLGIITIRREKYAAL